jgi:hypothetical protein
VGQGAHPTLERIDEQGPVGEISSPLFLGDTFFVDWLSIGERSSIGLPAVGGLFHHTKDFCAGFQPSFNESQCGETWKKIIQRVAERIG